ncbi:MAG: HlyD family type I secretion periplasmic adaptor subunit, partial [Gammaproteobacteria bacterium]|nr:HlyD family type I secretion periplasmic adaptor subunit [Gammaproteobacteria bacterium]
EVEMGGELERVRLSIPRLRSVIEESRRKVEQTRLDFQNTAKKELNEAVAEVSRIIEAQAALEDRVKRTTMRSPVKGTIQRLHINTIGGVIKPGDGVIEVIPREDKLLIELKIKPADIADISIGQLARIKFTAYDFSIYGSLEGDVAFISADTVTNEDGESHYIARIHPRKLFMGHAERPLPIKVGMVTDVDIITGKRTILQYLLKPIVRGMDRALGEM